MTDVVSQTLDVSLYDKHQKLFKRMTVYGREADQVFKAGVIVYRGVYYKCESNDHKIRFYETSLYEMKDHGS